MFKSTKSVRPDVSLATWFGNRENTRKELHDLQVKLDRYRATLRVAGAEIEHRNRVIRALTAFTYQASRLTEPAALLRLALSQALETTSAEAGAIILIDQETQNLTMGAHKGLSPDLVRILTGRQFDEGAAILMPHLVTGKGALLELSDSSDSGERSLLQSGHMNSLVSLPLQAGYQLLGALVVGTQDKPRFLPADLHGLLAIAQGTAVAWESLHLREKLWHMAETLLSQELQAATDSGAGLANLDLTPSPPALPPLQAKLANIVADIGGTMGAIFTLDDSREDMEITLAADYGLSPIFTSNFALCHLSDNFFPFDHLDDSNLLVKNLVQANASHALPLLVSLEEEGARSLLALRLKKDKKSQTDKAIFVAASTADAFSSDHFDQLIPEVKALIPLLTEVPSVPTFPKRSIHVPSLERQATDDDLENLLAAMMAAEEEVERHNADFSVLNAISEMLNRTLNLDKVLNPVLLKVRDVLQTEAAWIYLIDPASHSPITLNMQAHLGLSDRYVKGMKQLSLGDNLEGVVAKENRAFFVNDTSEQSDRCHLLIEVENILSTAAVPLACPEERDGHDYKRVVGVMVVAMRQLHTWRPRQIRLLTTIANQMAFAVNNAQLYAQVKEGMTSLTISNQVLQEINKLLIDKDEDADDNSES